jgi:hypothetical protein
MKSLCWFTERVLDLVYPRTDGKPVVPICQNAFAVRTRIIPFATPVSR